MKKILCILVFIFSITGNASANDSYPSMYQGAGLNWKSYFSVSNILIDIDNDGVADIKNSNPSMKYEHNYDTTCGQSFKAYFPGGAKAMNMYIVFPVEAATYTVRYNYPTAGGAANWKERTIPEGMANFSVRTADGQPATSGRWVFFEIGCPTGIQGFVSVRHSYQLDLATYAAWYNSVTSWQTNGDPPASSTSVPVDPGTDPGTDPVDPGTDPVDPAEPCDPEIEAVTDGFKIISDEAPALGSLIKVEDENKNSGKDKATFKVGYYLVSDAFKEHITDDNLVQFGTLITFQTVQDLPSEESFGKEYTFTMPTKFDFVGDARPWLFKDVNLACSTKGVSSEEGAGCVRFEKEFALADLKIDNFKIDTGGETSVTAGKTFKVSGNVVNSGYASIGVNKVKVGFYLLPGDAEADKFISMNSNLDGGKNVASMNKVISEGTLIGQLPLSDGSESLSSVEGENSKQFEFELSCSPDTPEGDFYLVAIVDPGYSVSEINEYNNVDNDSDAPTPAWDEVSGAQNLTVTAPVTELCDLSVAEVAADPKALYPGSALTVSYILENKGNIPVPENSGASVKIFLSSDEVFDDNDQVLGDPLEVPAIEAGEKIEAGAELTLSESIVPGQYYIIVVADPGFVLDEFSEENNGGLAAITVMPPLSVLSTVPEVVDLDSLTGAEFTAAVQGSPLYMGDVTSGGGNMEITTNFPAFSEAVDLYAAIALPNGKLIFINEDGSLSSDFTPYATGIEGVGKAHKICPSFPVNALFEYINAGTWKAIWLIVPSKSGRFAEIDWDRYIMGSYSFCVGPDEICNAGQ